MVYLQCVGPYCQPDAQSMTQPIEIVSSVGFVDASQQATGASAEQPKFSAKLPDDFFYPFTSSHGIDIKPVCSVLQALVLVSVRLIQVLLH